MRDGRNDIVSTKVVVLGARRRRQGIGQFVAGWFGDLGCDVCGIVGSRSDTVTKARATLRAAYGIDCRGYLDVAEAIEREQPDIVAVCTPIGLHAAHLAIVAEYGRHCLCEKPLVGLSDPGGADEIRRLVERFAENSRLLRLITQWPHTLEGYYAVHPDMAADPVEHFAMHLSPITTGPDMVPDCAPHPISMLRRLVGSGTVESCQTRFVRGDPERMRLDFVYRHGSGDTAVALDLATCRKRPAPAGYAINGQPVQREVDLDGYVQYFRDGDDRVRIPDPTRTLIADYLTGIAAGAATDAAGLLEDHESLTRLYESARRAR